MTRSTPKSAALVAACVLALGSAGKCRWCAGTLPAGRRTWCKPRCASSFWNNHWWPRARRAAKKRDKYRCRECGARPPLEVDHVTPCRGLHGVLSCLHHLANLRALCARCHAAKTFTSR